MNIPVGMALLNDEADQLCSMAASSDEAALVELLSRVNPRSINTIGILAADKLRHLPAMSNDKKGWDPHVTVLHVAALQGASKFVIGLMLSLGADVRALNSLGHTPLHFAGSAEVAELLINSGASVNGQSEKLLTGQPSARS